MKLHGMLCVVVVLLAFVSSARTQNRVESSGTALVVYGAGSLRVPLTQIAEEYQKRTGIRIEWTFGPSGVLRERIEKGERPDVFASADMASPRKLADQNLGTPVRAFTANAVCVVSRPGLSLDATSLLDAMLDPNVKIGAAQPVADPLGDYTEAVFAKADHLHPGAKAILDHKAIRLVGAPDAPKVPAGQESTSYYLVGGKQADMMITYCSGAQAAVQAVPALQVLQLPANLSVDVSFGYTVIAGSRPEAADFGRFLESDAAQAILLKNGFLKR